MGLRKCHLPCALQDLPGLSEHSGLASFREPTHPVPAGQLLQALPPRELMLQLIELEEAVEGSDQAAPAQSGPAATETAPSCSQPSLYELAATWADGQHHPSVATDRCVPAGRCIGQELEWLPLHVCAAVTVHSCGRLFAKLLAAMWAQGLHHLEAVKGCQIPAGRCSKLRRIRWLPSHAIFSATRTFVAFW